MNAVMGQVREAVERTKICAGIMKRYPGICRFMSEDLSLSLKFRLGASGIFL